MPIVTTDTEVDPAAGDGHHPPRPRKRRRLPLIVEILLALAAVALVQTFLVKPFGVPSQSMEQTLKIGDRIVVNRLVTELTLVEPSHP